MREARPQQHRSRILGSFIGDSASRPPWCAQHWASSLRVPAATVRLPVWGPCPPRTAWSGPNEGRTSPWAQVGQSGGIRDVGLAAGQVSDVASITTKVTSVARRGSRSARTWGVVTPQFARASAQPERPSCQRHVPLSATCRRAACASTVSSPTRRRASLEVGRGAIFVDTAIRLTQDHFKRDRGTLPVAARRPAISEQGRAAAHG
jgi:hypothetical protein